MKRQKKDPVFRGHTEAERRLWRAAYVAAVRAEKTIVSDDEKRTLTFAEIADEAVKEFRGRFPERHADLS
jgi:hypothetical protein